MASNGDGQRSESPSGSPSRSASISLQAAATLNAGLQRDPSPRSSPSSLRPQNRPSPSTSRRRSNVLMNLQLNDPAIPAPGEMVTESSSQRISSLSSSPLTADPNHHRAPSLGELHQELEAEQEAHVNRLLQTIRQQQLELQRLQAGHSISAEDSSAISDRPSQSVHTSQASISGAAATVGSLPRSPGFHHPRSSIDLHRRSRTPSRGASPRLRSTSISAESGDWVLGGRDESAFYQAETQMLIRENQMLRHRIRDLEKLLSDTSATPTEPAISSQLAQSNSAEVDEGAKTGGDRDA